MAGYSNRLPRPVGCNDQAMGGAALNLGIEALCGETEMITIFDDFNDYIPETELGAVSAADGTVNHWEENGWTMVDDPTTAPTGETIGMNDVAVVANDFDSCIRWDGGTGDDSGGNMQLDLINSTATGTLLGSGTNDTTFIRRPFPHLWIPETAAGTEILDSTVWMFACRLGLRADQTTTGDGDWNAKVFIGWAAAGDVSIMDHDTGVITTTAGNLHGFHIPEDGSIDGISKRTTADAMTDGTNFTELVAAGGVDGTVANGVAVAGDTQWFDLALRMDITDMSSDTANGTTEFYYRRVPAVTAGAGKNLINPSGEGYPTWVRHGTVLNNQTPNHTVALVPTIEFINGPTAGRDAMIFVDWWAFGRSRVSRSFIQA